MKREREQPKKYFIKPLVLSVPFDPSPTLLYAGQKDFSFISVLRHSLHRSRYTFRTGVLRIILLKPERGPKGKDRTKKHRGETTDGE